MQFPLPEGHYFYTRAVSPRAHAGETKVDRDPIAQMQRALGVTADGYIDEETLTAAAARVGRKWTGVIDADAWKVIMKPKRKPRTPR